MRIRGLSNRRILLKMIFVLIPVVVLAAAPDKAVFYGVPKAAATEQILMAQDLFYNKLASLNTITLEDHRDISYQEAKDGGLLPAAGIIFYISIENVNESWAFSFNGELPETGKKASYAKSYDSFYKILIEAGSSIQAVMASLVSPDAEPVKELTEGTVLKPSVEMLAGTWGGEEFIDKIVILRSGRGFVIYKNGATMNITVAIDGSTVTLTQSGRPNASFYPDIPRQIALVSAQSAQPISWTMKVTGQDNMMGTKRTLAPIYGEGGDIISAEQTEISVQWSRRSN